MTFDRQKLERLRAKFGDAGGNEIFDPHFRAVADSVFKDSDKRPPPYAGVPTLACAATEWFANGTMPNVLVSSRPLDVAGRRSGKTGRPSD
jgi:hypothetical protein